MPDPTQLKCPADFLMGPPGSGKSTSLTTYIEAGLDLFVVITDPGGEEALLDAMERNNLPMDKLHYSYVACATASWDALMEVADIVNRLTYEGLSGVKIGASPEQHRQYLSFLSTLANFKDDRTGEEFGAVEKFGADCAFAIDSLSGVNIMALDLKVGSKATAHEGEWGVAMRVEEKLMQKIVSDCRCFTCITAHVDKYFNESTGQLLQMPSFLGKKLAPKVPRLFSDIIMAVKDGAKFSWSTALEGADLKTRNLPIENGLAPSFVPVVEKWRARQEQASRKSATAPESGKAA